MIETTNYHTEAGDIHAVVVRKYGETRDLLVDAADADGNQPHMVMAVPFWKRLDKVRGQIGVDVGGGPIMGDTDVEVEVFNSWRPA